MKKILIPVLVLIAFSSCSNYYKAITAAEPTNAASYSNFTDSMKYFILHNGSESFSMKNISVSSDRKTIQCTLDVVPYEHKLYINAGPHSKRKYKTKSASDDDESGVLNEVHIYLPPGSKAETGPYTLPLEKIHRAEILEKDLVKTKKSHTAGTIIGVSITVIGIVVLGALIIAASTVPLF